MREVIRIAGQAAGEAAVQAAGLGLVTGQVSDQLAQSERKRVEAVVQTLATLRGEGETLAELAHDARNMVTALGLYCDLLEEPGVLATQFAHYGSELRLVAAASRSLVEKLVAIDVRGIGIRGVALRGSAVRGSAGTVSAGNVSAGTVSAASGSGSSGDAGREGSATLQPGTLQAARPEAVIKATPEIWAGAAGSERSTAYNRAGRWDSMPPALISNFAQELLLSRNLLGALAGPAIALSVDVEGGALPVRLNPEDLTRVLVNLVKNAAEAMPVGGSIRICLRKRSDAGEAAASTAASAESGGDACADPGRDASEEPGRDASAEPGRNASADPGRVANADPGGDSSADLNLLANPGKSSRRGAESGAAEGCNVLSLTIEDTGPGIPLDALERIFEAGFTTRATGTAERGGWHSAHRGLGLSITRSIVEAAGGRIFAINREGGGAGGSGARFEILLPVRGH